MKNSDDIRIIREIMEKSSRFISLSGLSGVGAGVIALLGAGAAWLILNGYLFVSDGMEQSGYTGFTVILAALALIILVSAVSVAFFFSFRKSKKLATPFWTPVTTMMLVHLSVPLAAGGLFSMILIYNGIVWLIPPVMLIFYGLALVSAGKYTFSEINLLGLSEVVTGLIACLFPGYGLWFWTFGFGVLHIVYGVIMHLRYR